MRGNFGKRERLTMRRQKFENVQSFGKSRGLVSGVFFSVCRRGQNGGPLRQETHRRVCRFYI